MSVEAYQIKEYKIIKNKKIPTLTEDVNKSISDGWEPLGGVTVSFCENVGVVCQAMIKRHDI